MVITKIGVLSLGKVMGVTYALMGLLIGGCLALISLTTAGFASASDESGSGLPAVFGAMFGVGAVILAPILYGVMGFIGGLIGAVIYNVVAGMIGGLELDVS
jgi:hypothetical protein